MPISNFDHYFQLSLETKSFLEVLKISNSLTKDDNDYVPLASRNLNVARRLFKWLFPVKTKCMFVNDELKY